MRLASIYLYVSDMNTETKFWRAMLQNEPLASSDKWTEFTVGDARIGLLLDDESINPVNSTSVLVLEVKDKEIDEYSLERKLQAAVSSCRDCQVESSWPHHLAISLNS